MPTARMVGVVMKGLDVRYPLSFLTAREEAVISSPL